MRIAEHIVNDIYSRNDIVEVIRGYVPDLKKNGATWKGKSPFQNEKTPSFVVWPSTQTFKDFSSGKQGNVVGFVMAAENIEYREALEFLAKRAKIEIAVSKEEKQKEAERMTFVGHNMVAKNIFCSQREKQDFSIFVKERSLTSKSIEEFGLGWCGPGFPSEALEYGCKEEILKNLGLLKQGPNGLINFFGNRVIFPIQNIWGDIVGFAGRKTSNGNLKYLNSPNSPIYSKSSILYGANFAKKSVAATGVCILVEGYMDVISLHQNEICNSVGICSTSLTKEQVVQIKRLAREVIIVLDGDGPGIKAVGRSIKSLVAGGLNCRVATLENDHDPDSFINEFGKEAFLKLVKEPPLWVDYLLGEIKDEKPDKVAEKAKNIQAIINAIPNRYEKEIFASHLTTKLRDSFGLQTQEESTNGRIEKTSEGNGLQDPHHIQLREVPNWEEFENLRGLLGINTNKDFQRNSDGSIQVHFKDINGNPYRITEGRNKVNAQRKIGQVASINAVYVPPKLREGNFPIEAPLIICHSEITAYLLSEVGIPSVAINKHLGFLSRPKKKDLHILIKQVLVKHNFKEFVLVMPHNAFELPSQKETNNPFEYVDAGEYGKDALDTLLVFQEAMKRDPASCVYPALVSEYIDYKDERWIDRLLIQLFHGAPDHWRSHLAMNLIQEIMNPENEDFFSLLNINRATPFSIKDALKISNPISFLNLHGVNALGQIFQLGTNVYKYNPRDESVALYSQAADEYCVWEEHRRYYGSSRSGGKEALCDFTMEYHLEVKQKSSFALVEFTSVSGKSAYSVLAHKELISPDVFQERIGDIEGVKLNWWGSKKQLSQLHAMLRKNVPEAKSLEGTLGYHPEFDIWVWGNGLSLTDGTFLPADENGIVLYEDKRYFIPASADFTYKDDLLYESEFVYEEPVVSFLSWADQFIKVNGMAGHVSLSYVIASIFRDLFKSTLGRFPNFSLQSPPSSGKSFLFDSLKRLFGMDLRQTNLQTKVTIASFERKMRLFSNVVLVMNEFQLSNEKVRKIGLAEYLKGTYDFQGGEKTVNDKSKHMLPRSSFFLIGQESFWEFEALIQRCIVQELPRREVKARSKEERERARVLRGMERVGISGFIGDVFKHRAIIKENLAQNFNTIYELLSGMINNPIVDTRQIENWAIILAPICTLINKKCIEYPLDTRSILNHAALCITEQAKNMQDLGVLAIFFSFIESEYGPGRLLDHQDIFHFKPKDELRIRFNTVYKAFMSYVKRERFTIENLSKSDVLGRLMEHESFDPDRQKQRVQVGYMKGPNGEILYSEPEKPEPAKCGGRIVTLKYSEIPDFMLPDIAWLGASGLDIEPKAAD